MIGAVLAHGSGLDELAIFVFPVVMGLGFWLITRQKAKGGDGAEADEAPTPPVATIASEVPNAPKPVNGRHVSPFHSMIQMPDVRVPADDDAPDQSAATTTSA